MKALTPKQARFVAEYLIDLNATQAAIRAGYSPKTAKSVGSENLTKPDIAAAVAERQAVHVQKIDITAVRVLQELGRLGFSDARKLFKADGSLKPAAEWDDETAAAVAGVDVVEMAGGAKIGGPEGVQHVPMFTKKLKLWDKNSALEKIAKHLGLLTDKVHVSGELTTTTTIVHEHRRT